MAHEIRDGEVLRASDTVRDDEQDPALVRETVTRDQPGDTQVLRSSSSVAAQRRADLIDRYGGFYWGSDFIGFAVATFFTILFLGIVGAVVGAVGYQLGAPVPKIGGSISGTTQNLGIGALVGSLIAVFLAYFLGGYTAGRMARFEGAKNGFGVWLWTIIVAVLLGAAGAILGSNFNVANQLHLKIDMATLTAAGGISLAVTLVVMLVGAVLGGRTGERYHRAIDRDAGVR